MSMLSEHQEQKAAPVGAGHPVLPKVNLLPPEIAQAARFRRIQLALGGGVVAALGTVTLLYVLAVGSVSDATVQLEAANGRVCIVGRGDLVVVAVASLDANVGMIRVELLRAAEALA